MTLITRFIHDEGGASAVEYAVLLALIIGMCVVSIGFFGGEAGGSWLSTSSSLETFMNN
jgi:Flp pilus assembly pilin Flp